MDDINPTEPVTPQEPTPVETAEPETPAEE
jgi:hypothetical protein